MKIIGLFLAKESKRLPNKNIMEIAGKPMYRWVMDEAAKSKIDELWVSTGVEQYKEIFRRAGLKVMDRPAKLMGDRIVSMEVIKDFASQHHFNYLVHLDFTMPLTKAETIDKFIDKALEGYDSVIGTKKLRYTLLWDKPLCSNDPDRINKYYYYGCCNVRTKRCCMEYDGTDWGEGKKNFYMQIEDEYNIDINTYEDYYIVEQLLKYRKAVNTFTEKYDDRVLTVY